MARNITLVGGALIFHDHIYGIENDGTKDGLCSFKGIVGDVVNIFTKILSRNGYRCILERGTEMGIYDRTSDSYTGLLGRLQRGEIDIVTVPVYYPLMDSDDKFCYTAALHDDTMTLCSGYHINEESHEGKLFTMFTTVPYGLWVGYFLSFLLFIALSIYGTRKLKRSYPSIWTMTSAFMEQYYFPSGSRFTSFISFVVSISVFIMMTYAKNSMRTDLVTIDKPIVITTYDEIIDRGVKVAFAKVVPEWEQFHNAPTGSKEHALFTNHVSILLTPDTANWIIQEMMDQRIVVIGRPVIGYTAALMQLGFGNFPKDGRFYFAPDKVAKKYTNVFAMSSRMKGTHAMKMAYDMIQMMNERGFYQYLMDCIPSLISTLLHGNLGSAPSLHEKISPQIEVGEGDVSPIGWQHFSQVIYLLYTGLMVASIVLFLERIWFIVTTLANSVSAEPSRRRRRRKRPRQ